MATITGILTNDDGTKRRVSLRIESPVLLHAIQHGRGEVDQVMTDLLATMLGNYEDAMGANNYQNRQRVYANNALRKIVKNRWNDWLNGKGVT